MEIILRRLGTFYLPHWMQMKYFEHLGFSNIIVLEQKTLEITKVEKREYRNNPKHKSFMDNRYAHYKVVDNPNPHSFEYFYTTENDLSKISLYEKDVEFLNDDEIQKIFDECFKKKDGIDDDNRKDKFMIELVKEYQKTFPEGDKQSWFGDWCYNVVDIPDDVEYEIDEPEGCNECIREVHRIWNFLGEQVGKGVQK